MRNFIQSLPHPIANALLIARRLRTAFFEDGLLTVTNADFRKQPAFAHAYAAAKATGSFANWDVRWRIHVLTWFAKLATRVEGDFVECGVDHGGTAMGVLQLTEISDRTFWLLDTFKGLDAGQLTAAEQRTAGFLDYEDSFERVSRTFADQKNVRLIRGTVPQTLPLVTAPKVAFLHLDMNATVPEIAALQYFWPLMPAGGIVVMDDYGWPRHREQKAGFDRFAAEQPTAILQLPTGQGVMVKR
jgi:O-methyltransferase